VTKRYSHGLDFTTAFAWQKEQQTGEAVNDVFNRPNQKALSSQSIPLTLVVGFNYELPGLTGNRFARQIIGGWTLGGILRYSSGLPIAVPTSNNQLAQTPTRNPTTGAVTNGFGFYNTAVAVSTQTGGTIPNSRNGQLIARFQW